jgi:hypothetical protein
MASAYQLRVSINAWLKSVLPIDEGKAGDQVAFQASEKQRGTEWRVYWDAERAGLSDQSFSRLLQIDRMRDGGNEIALERDWAQALTAMGIDKPGQGPQVPMYDYPDSPETVIGSARVRRIDDAGWQMLPDAAGRIGQLRSTLTLRITYAG